MDVVIGWASAQSWWGIVTTVVAIASFITMTLKDQYAEKLPFIGKIWPVMNWLSLNVAENKNAK
tara:strand:- start:8 stop:199 length:192 start_codon:yes stop_codon:yes gene_type:complete